MLHLSQLDPVPPYIAAVCAEDGVACTIYVHYALSVARTHGAASTMRALAVLPRCSADIVYCDTTLHELVSALGGAPDSFASAELSVVVFDKFFMVGAALYC